MENSINSMIVQLFRSIENQSNKLDWHKIEYLIIETKNVMIYATSLLECKNDLVDLTELVIFEHSKVMHENSLARMGL